MRQVVNILKCWSGSDVGMCTVVQRSRKPKGGGIGDEIIAPHSPDLVLTGNGLCLQSLSTTVQVKI